MKTSTTLWIMLLGISVLMSGCDKKFHHTDALNAKINSKCEVFFNRQAIGEIEMSGGLYSQILRDSQGLYFTAGTLKQVTKEWIVIERSCSPLRRGDTPNTLIDERMTLWIPRNVVLCVRTDFD